MQEILVVVTVVLVGLMVGVELALAAFVNPIFDRLPNDGGLAARSDGARLLGRVMPLWYRSTSCWRGAHDGSPAAHCCSTLCLLGWSLGGRAGRDRPGSRDTSRRSGFGAAIAGFDDAWQQCQELPGSKSFPAPEAEASCSGPSCQSYDVSPSCGAGCQTFRPSGSYSNRRRLPHRQLAPVGC